MVDSGFFDIMDAHIDLVEASPDWALQALFHLGGIAVSHHLNGWMDRIAKDGILEVIRQVRDNLGWSDELIRVANQLLLWVEQSKQE
jgi:hypothetical protein